jgi:hypothetical protein
VPAISSRSGKHSAFDLKIARAPGTPFCPPFHGRRVSDRTDSWKTRPSHFRPGQDMSDRLLPPVTSPNFSCTRASLFRGSFDHRYALASAENDQPHGDRAVHAADSRSVLRLGAIYDPLRPARLESARLFTLAARTTIRTSGTPVVHRVGVAAIAGRTIRARCTEDRLFYADREDDAAFAIWSAFRRSSFEASPPGRPSG